MKNNRIYAGLIFLLLLGGCALKVTAVGEYDPILDESIHNIESQTAEHYDLVISNKGMNDGSYSNQKAFYSKMRGEVQALIIRAEIIENELKLKPLTDNLNELLLQYKDLELLHQISEEGSESLVSSFESAREATDQSFRAIVKYMLYLKWNQKQPVLDEE